MIKKNKHVDVDVTAHKKQTQVKSLLMQSGKLSCGVTNQNFKFLLETMETVSSGLKRRGTIRVRWCNKVKSILFA